MKLNVILDSRLIDRYHPLMAELEKHKIEYELWPCLIFPTVVESINLSHKMIVRDAMEKKLPEVAIAEDDLWFPAHDGWEYFLRNKPMPHEYDIYSASTYCLPASGNVICGFHLYIVSARFYEQYLSVRDNEHIDTAIDETKCVRKICYPFAALQRPSFSSNHKAEVNYNYQLNPEDVYGW